MPRVTLIASTLLCLLQAVLTNSAPDTTKLIYPISVSRLPPDPTSFTLDAQPSLLPRHDATITTSALDFASTNQYSTDDFGLLTPLNSEKIASLSALGSAVDASFTSAESMISSYLGCVGTETARIGERVSKCDTALTATDSNKHGGGERLKGGGNGWLVGGIMGLLAL